MKEKSPLTISQALELLSSLEAHGTVPLKFSYLGDGHFKWINIAEMSRKSGGIEKIENELLIEKLPCIFEELSKNNIEEFNVVDLGCGDGKPIEAVFLYLRENNYFEKYKRT